MINCCLFTAALAVTSLLSLQSCKSRNTDSAVVEPERVIAFPGAEGFGRYASGGRGGDVYHVTTLADGNEPGTLRYAVNQKGPRTVVFDVAGTIMLDKMLRITESDLSIAGQTAPSDSI